MVDESYASVHPFVDGCVPEPLGRLRPVDRYEYLYLSSVVLLACPLVAKRQLEGGGLIDPADSASFGVLAPPSVASRIWARFTLRTACLPPLNSADS